MKKTLITITVLTLFATSMTLSCQAINLEKERGKINVSTTANTEVAPDVAEISFAVQTFDTKSMQNASIENKKISDKVFTELKSLINTNNGDYIKTSDYSAQPVYSYINSKKVFEKYQVSNRIVVHTKSIDKVGEMIDKATTLGATNIDNLSFSVSNYESHCNDLITIATQKAQTRASVIAKALGTSLDGISNISTSCSTNNYNPPRLYMAKNYTADTAEGSFANSLNTDISNGLIKVVANVNANFFVK